MLGECNNMKHIGEILIRLTNLKYLELILNHNNLFANVINI